MSEFADFMGEHVWLSVLRLLDGAPGYAANDSILTQGVEQLGLSCTRDQMRGHLSWLQEQRLVNLIRPAAGVTVATLTERGSDVASGRSHIPGVQRPAPKG